MYPEYANIDGQRYKLRTDFRVGLRCFKVIEDGSICDEERALAVIYLLFGFVPDTDLQLFLNKATLFLQCGKTKEEHEEQKKDMDFEHDKSYISASFMSDYRIDLNAVNMHWWQFCELIQGLTEHCVLSRVRDIRNYNLSDIKDNQARMRMAKAQQKLALPVKYTKEELEAIEAFERLFEGGDVNG